MSLGVLSCTSANDSAHATAVLDGAAVGALGFRATREPVFSDASQVVLLFTGTGPYTVTLPGVDLWYLWATDNNAPSTNCLPVWIGGSDSDFLDEVGQAVAGILTTHKPAIEARVRPWSPGTTIKQVMYGFPGAIEEWPAIVVQRPKFIADWYAMPSIKLYHLTLEIAIVTVRSTEVSELKLVGRIMSAVVAILTKREQITMPSGSIACRCQAEEGNVEEQMIDGTSHFITMARLQWSGDVMRQEGY